MRFNFHTAAYFTSFKNISVYNNYFKETSVELPDDTNGVPYFLYHAENISSSTYISINKKLTSTRDDLAIIILIIATGAPIGLPFFGAKRMRKSAFNLSLMGFVCFALFIWVPEYNFLSWGTACLMLYVIAGLIIVSKFMQRNRVWNSLAATRSSNLRDPRLRGENNSSLFNAYQESVMNNAKEFGTWTRLANSWLRAGNLPKAREACLKALDSQPIDLAYINDLRIVGQKLGIDTTPLAPETLVQVGERLFANRIFKKAQELFFVAYKGISPESPLKAETTRWLKKCTRRNWFLTHPRSVPLIRFGKIGSIAVGMILLGIYVGIPIINMHLIYQGTMVLVTFVALISLIIMRRRISRYILEDAKAFRSWHQTHSPGILGEYVKERSQEI